MKSQLELLHHFAGLPVVLTHWLAARRHLRFFFRRTHTQRQLAAFARKLLISFDRFGLIVPFDKRSFGFNRFKLAVSLHDLGYQLIWN